EGASDSGRSTGLAKHDGVYAGADGPGLAALHARQAGMRGLPFANQLPCPPAWFTTSAADSKEKEGSSGTAMPDADRPPRGAHFSAAASFAGNLGRAVELAEVRGRGRAAGSKSGAGRSCGAGAENGGSFAHVYAFQASY